jgi:hypothetical protein
MRKVGGRKKAAEAAESPAESYATGTNMFRKLRVKPFSTLGPITEHPSRGDASTSRTGSRTRTPRRGNADSGSLRDDRGVDKPSEPTSQVNPQSPTSSTKRKRGLGLFRNKVLRGNGTSRKHLPHARSHKSTEIVKPTEAATEEAPAQKEEEESELTDHTVQERAARLYDVLNQSQTTTPQVIEAARQRKPFDCASRLEPIPEKAVTVATVTTLAPFTWNTTFGCAAPEVGDTLLSPPLSPGSSAMSSPPTSPTCASDSVPPIDSTQSAETSSTYGSAPLYSEGVSAKEDNGIASPIFAALQNLDDALRADPNVTCPPPTSLAASKSGEEFIPPIGAAENPRIESYRLGYLLAQVGLPDETSGCKKTCPSSSDETPPSSDAPRTVDPPTQTGASLGEVIQSIKKSAASEDIANVNLARVAADLAAASEPNVDRDALKRGYLRRVSEIVRGEEKKGEAKGASTKRTSSEVVKHAKTVLRDIECALNDAPVAPRSGDFTGLRLDNWSWLQSKSTEAGAQPRDVPREASLHRASSAASRRDGIKDNLTIVNLLSFFKSKEEVDVAEDLESEDSSSTSESSRSSGSSSRSGSSSGASSSHSSGVDISVPSRSHFVFSSTSIDARSAEEVESEISVGSGSSSDSGSCSDSESVSFSYSDQSGLSLGQKSSRRSRDGRPITPLGLLSFIRAVSKVKSGESLPADEQPSLTSVESSAGANVPATKIGVDPTREPNHPSRKHETRADGSKRKFSPRSLFKQTNSTSKPPLHPVKSTIEQSPTSESIESTDTTKHVELNLADIVITSAVGGDGSESIELCTTSPAQPCRMNTSQLVEVEMTSNEQGDQVACEVKPRSDGVWNADESRDDIETMEQAPSMEHVQSMSFSTKRSQFGGRETCHPPLSFEKHVSPSCDQVPSYGLYNMSHTSTIPPGAKNLCDHPIANDGRVAPVGEHFDGSVLDTDTVGTEGVDLLELLVGSESGALWGRDGTKESSESGSPSGTDCDDHSLAQSEPNIQSSISNVQSKVRNHGRGPSHKRCFSGPPSLLLNSVERRPSAD